MGKTRPQTWMAGKWFFFSLGGQEDKTITKAWRKELAEQEAGIEMIPRHSQISYGMQL